MLIGMPGINDRRNEQGGLTPAELALIKASLNAARTTAEGLLRRADALTAKAESRARQAAPGVRAGRQAGGAFRESR